MLRTQGLASAGWSTGKRLGDLGVAQQPVTEFSCRRGLLRDRVENTVQCCQRCGPAVDPCSLSPATAQCTNRRHPDGPSVVSSYPRQDPQVGTTRRTACAYRLHDGRVCFRRDSYGRNGRAEARFPDCATKAGLPARVQSACRGLVWLVPQAAMAPAAMWGQCRCLSAARGPSTPRCGGAAADCKRSSRTAPRPWGLSAMHKAAQGAASDAGMQAVPSASRALCGRSLRV